MSTFSQWWLGFQKNKAVRQFTWLSGTERVLVEEIVTLIKQELAPAPWNYSHFVVGDDSERAIWADVGQYPMDSGKRLVVIRNAEKMKSFDRLADFISHRTLNPRTYLVLISNEERLARVPGEDGKTVYAPHLATFGTKGHLVECRPFTQDTARHAVSWVMQKTGMREGVAGHLLERANGDLRLVRDVCEKLTALGGTLSMSSINGMLAERPRDTFANSLMAMDKRTALLALTKMNPTDYSRTIGFLDSRLDLAGLVHDMTTQQKTPSEISKAAGDKRFLVSDLIPVAKHYDLRRRSNIRRILTSSDEALRQGARVGVMESLVAQW